MAEPWRAPPPGDAAAILVATVGGIGFLKPAPGTWGSLAGAAGGWALLWATDGAFWALAAALVAVSLAGLWAAAGYARATGVHDAGPVVIDEVAGQWIALAAVPALGTSMTLQHAAAAFVLFRLFDIWKPGPIGWADRSLPGALGVMADDWLAGLAAGLALAALMTWGGL